VPNLSKFCTFGSISFLVPKNIRIFTPSIKRILKTDDRSRITYVYQKKERNFNNPEEMVQAETFLRLILDYHYPESRIRQFVPVTMGSE
jgi:type I restriction enzyme M protein